jgi:sugar phosphate isomerase/epimerase
MKRRDVIRTILTGSALALSGQGIYKAMAKSKILEKSKWPIGHHFWNWPRAWNNDLDLRLRLTKETGYLGFESKPDEIGVSPEVLKEKCAQYGVVCAGISASVKEAIDYSHAAGVKMVRAQFSKDQTKKWVEYAGERGIILTVHNHIGNEGNRENAVETREHLLRYLDERPGMFACPDTGHLLLCGSDPVQTILDLGERCKAIHLKDLNPSCKGVNQRCPDMWWELGMGCLDVPGVMQALEKINYDGWVMVEYDNKERDYKLSAQRMRQVLKDNGY